MTYAHPGFQPSSIARLRSWVEGRLRAIRPLLNPIALAEGWRESLEGYPADPEHEPHLVAAIAWLARAQDATPDGGISRAFTLAWHPHFGRRGWQPPYPETTGYIIPTFYAAARRWACPGLSARAERAARWEIDIQLPAAAAGGGVLGEPESPAVFNTGQVLLGLLAAFEKTAQGSFADAARRAARYLVAMLEGDGHWRRGNSRFARADATLYNTRTAWALAEAGVRLADAGSPMPPLGACALLPSCRRRTVGCLIAASPIPSGPAAHARVRDPGAGGRWTGARRPASGARRPARSSGSGGSGARGWLDARSLPAGLVRCRALVLP